MKCTFQKPDDEACGSNAMNGQSYCFFHNPDISEAERKAAQSKGGKGNAIAITNPLPAVQISKAGDVVKLLEETINLVRAGEIDVKVGNCVGVLSGHLLKALEVESIATRVEVIERAILERRTRIS